jgi:hypothetical protein
MSIQCILDLYDMMVKMFVVRPADMFYSASFTNLTFALYVGAYWDTYDLVANL